MAKVSPESVAGIAQSVRDRLPSVADLFGTDEVEHLAAAWEAGNSRAFGHPLIELLLADGFEEHAKTVDAGLARMRAQGDVDLTPHVHRLTLPKATTTEFTEALGAVNELYVAAALAAAGARVVFVATGSERTPDICAEIGEERITLEVVTWGLPGGHVKDANRKKHAFDNWKRGKPVPKDLEGSARDHGDGLRMLERSVPLLKGNTLAERVDALARKKDSSQLRDRPNPVLVISARHQWGVSASDCLPRQQFRGGLYSGVCYASVYGRAGDYLFQGEEFDGKGQKVVLQLGDGILRRSTSTAAVLFLFNKGDDVVMENLQPSSGLSSYGLRRFLGKAFRLDAGATVLKQGW